MPIDRVGLVVQDNLISSCRDLNTETLSKIKEITCKIAEALNVSGPFNMQLIAKDNDLKAEKITHTSFF